MCAHNQHTMVDTDELGELNMTLEMDSKKSYKWVMVISQLITPGWYCLSGITALLEGGCFPEKCGASGIICLHLSEHWEEMWAQSSRDSVCA